MGGVPLLPGLGKRGYPIPGLGKGAGGIRSTPNQVWMGYAPRPGTGYPPGPGMGCPQTWDRVPPTPWTWDRVPPRPGMGYPPPQTWDRVPPGPGTRYPRTWDPVPPQTWDSVPPWTWDRVPPRPRTGYPPWTRSGLDRVLAMRRAVCLLRSRRRTFLFHIQLLFMSVRWLTQSIVIDYWVMIME